MNDVQVTKATLLAMQRETDNLRKIIARLLQVSTLMEKLQRISVDLESVIKQLKWQEYPTQHPASQSKLTTQEFYERHHTTQQDIQTREECNVFHSTVA